MKRLALLFISFVMLAAGVAVARQPDMADVWNGSEINWRDVRSGIYESSKTGQPVLMVFHASWCPSCKKYRKVFFDKRVVEASRGYVMILVDADADKMVNGAFAPDGTYVPRTIFLDSQGNIQSQLHGAGDPNYPHSIDIERPDELLSLMQKGQDGIKVAPPSETAADHT